MDDEKKGLPKHHHTRVHVSWKQFGMDSFTNFRTPNPTLMGKEVSGGNDAEAKDWKNVKILHSGKLT